MSYRLVFYSRMRRGHAATRGYYRSQPTTTIRWKQRWTLGCDYLCSRRTSNVIDLFQQYHVDANMAVQVIAGVVKELKKARRLLFFYRL